MLFGHEISVEQIAGFAVELFVIALRQQLLVNVRWLYRRYGEHPFQLVAIIIFDPLWRVQVFDHF